MFQKVLYPKIDFAVKMPNASHEQVDEFSIRLGVINLGLIVDDVYYFIVDQRKNDTASTIVQLFNDLKRNDSSLESV